MELRQLRYVLAIAEEQNLTRAAERLGIQPPPLSRQLRSIERDIGAQLFRRKARGVELTPAGQAFIDNARAILAQVDNAVEATRRTARGEQGRVTVGYSSTVAFHPLVPRIIREFREAFPLVEVTLIEGYPEDLVERMQRDELDACFIRQLQPGVGAIDVALLHRETMVVALPAGHRLAGGGKGSVALSLKALADETFVLFGDPGRDALQRNRDFVSACQAAGFYPRIGHVVPFITSRLNLIASGLGIAVVAASLRHVSIEGLSFRPLKGTMLRAPFGLAQRRGDHSLVIRQFTKSAKQTARSYLSEQR